MAKARISENGEIITQKKERKKKRKERREKENEKEKSTSEREMRGLAFFRGNLVRRPLEPCFFPIAVQTGLRKSDLLITRPGRSSLRCTLMAPQHLPGSSAPLILFLAANDTTCSCSWKIYDAVRNI